MVLGSVSSGDDRVAPRLFHRISGIALIFLVAFKVCTGAAMHRASSAAGLDAKELHAATPTADKLLLFFFIFHAVYGIRLILIDLGVKWDRLLFWIVTLLGIVLFSGSYWLIFAG